MDFKILTQQILVSVILTLNLGSTARASDMCLSLFLEKPSSASINLHGETTTERPFLLFPWHKITVTRVEPKRSGSAAEIVEADLQAKSALLDNIQSGKVKLSSGDLNARSREFIESASIKLSEYGVTHEIVESRSILGIRHLQIRILTMHEGANPTPLSYLADRMEKMGAELRFDFKQLAKSGAISEVLPSLKFYNLFLRRFSIEKFVRMATEIFSENHHILVLPLEAILKPEIASYLPVVSHEIAHIESFWKRLTNQYDRYATQVEASGLFSHKDLVPDGPAELLAVFDRGYQTFDLSENPAMMEGVLGYAQNLRHINSRYYKNKTTRSSFTADLKEDARWAEVMHRSSLKVLELIQQQMDRGAKPQFIFKEGVTKAVITIETSTNGNLSFLRFHTQIFNAHKYMTNAELLNLFLNQIKLTQRDLEQKLVLAQWATQINEVRQNPSFTHIADFELARVFAQSLYFENNLQVTPTEFRRNLENRFTLAAQQWRPE